MQADLLAWLNVLLVPAIVLLVRISIQVAVLQARHEHHSKRMDLIERSQFE